MSIATQKERLLEAKESLADVVEYFGYYGETVDSNDRITEYYESLKDVPFLMTPENINYNYGYIDGNGWHYENNGGQAKNPIDIYKIEMGHKYYVMLGEVIGTRFRVCTVADDIRTKTSGTYCAQSLSTENAPKYSWPGMTYSNPEYPDVSNTSFFTAAIDGWLLIQKDNNYNLNVKSYVFDLDTPLTSVSGGSHEIDESYFDIDNGVITLKSTVDKESIIGRKSVPGTVNGQTVTGIGDHCFDGCSGIGGLEIPNTVTTIGDYAFAHLLIVYFDIPSSVTSLGDYVFYACLNLREMTLPSTLSTIGQNIFNGCKALASVNIQMSMTALPEGTFSGCSKLDFNYLTIPNTIHTFERYAFYNNQKLNRLPTTSNLSVIEEYCFGMCYNITNINIPYGITHLPRACFYRCLNSSTVTIPSTVTSMLDKVFSGCSKLTEITIEATTPPTLSNIDSFENTNNCPIYVPDASVNAYKTANVWSDLADRIFGVSSKGN